MNTSLSLSSSSALEADLAFFREVVSGAGVVSEQTKVRLVRKQQAEAETEI